MRWFQHVRGEVVDKATWAALQVARSEFRLRWVEVPQLEAVVSKLFPDMRGCRISPISGGEIHQVYRLDGASRSLVARCALDGHDAFESEAKALEHCRSAGLIAPEILAIEHLDNDDGHVCICIESLVGGTSLDSLLLGEAQWDRLASAAYAKEIGAYLGRLHSIRPSDPVLHPGRTGNSWEAWATFYLPSKPEEVELGDSLDRAVGDAAAEALRSARENYLACKVMPGLVHGDPKLEHFFFEDGPQVSLGMIDFEDSGVGDGAYDLAWLDLFWGDLVDISDVLAGYTGPAEGLYFRIAVCRLKLALGLSKYFEGMGHPVAEHLLAQIEPSLRLLQTAMNDPNAGE